MSENSDAKISIPGIPPAPMRRVSASEPTSVQEEIISTPVNDPARTREQDGTSGFPPIIAIPDLHTSEASVGFGELYDDIEEVPSERAPAKTPIVGVANFSEDYGRSLNIFRDLPPKAMLNAQKLINSIADDVCSEVLLNGPKEITHKVGGARYQLPIEFSTSEEYHDVINLIIKNYCKDNTEIIDGEHGIIEGQIELPSLHGDDRAPMLARLHIIAPPAVEYAKITIAKKPRIDLTLDALAENGNMTYEMAEFVKAAVQGRQTIVISGSSGSGKTTLLQALTHHFDQNDRVIVIEETPELRLSLGDVVYLHATSEIPGQDPDSIYSLEIWTKQANRMRADRIIVGEIRGSEMAEFLNVANSGIEGSATTIHANTPPKCLEKILNLATKSLTSTSETQLQREIANTVDLIIQLGLVDGRHIVTDIEEITDVVNNSNNKIQTNKLFEYNKITGRHSAVGNPSTEMKESLANNGVDLNPQWFSK